MDLGTVLGLILAFAVILGSVMIDASLGAFANGPAVMIIVGGAFFTTLVCTPLHVMKQLIGITKKAFFHKAESPETLIATLMSFAEIARRDGILSLESKVKDLQDPFLIRGIQMAIDGTDPELIEKIMSSEVEVMMERHEHAKTVFENLGRFAPAFGIIGTVIGLVGMFSHMEKPEDVGKGMAVALLATLYGAVVANVVALPLADKLSKRSAEEVLAKTIVIKGVMSIQSGDNPRMLERKLKVFLPPSERGESLRDAA